MTSEQTGHVTGFLDPLEGLLEEADGRTDGVVDERRDEEPEPCPAIFMRVRVFNQKKNHVTQMALEGEAISLSDWFLSNVRIMSIFA